MDVDGDGDGDENDWETTYYHICTLAAHTGRFELLKALRERGCRWYGRAVIRELARHGDLEMLRWAREHGCAWDERVCVKAAKGGHLHVLRWAIENGCPHDESEFMGRMPRELLIALAWHGLTQSPGAHPRTGIRRRAKAAQPVPQLGEVAETKGGDRMDEEEE